MRTSIAVEVGHTVRRPCCGEELGARGVEHADDDAADAEVLLGDLADHDVRVVAVRRDDDRVGAPSIPASSRMSVSSPWPTRS